MSTNDEGPYVFKFGTPEKAKTVLRYAGYLSAHLAGMEPEDWRKLWDVDRKAYCMLEQLHELSTAIKRECVTLKPIINEMPVVTHMMERHDEIMGEM